MRCGIVGLPNVGKSSLFNALTNSSVASENFPFCTIDPHVGTVAVPDERLEQLSEMVKSQKIIPATVEFIDIAGLVAGAASGEGLGNEFLSHVREAEILVHVVRCFDDQDVMHVHGKIDPIHDIETIATELLLADMSTATSALRRVSRKTRDQDSLALIECYSALVKHIEEGKHACSFSFSHQKVDEWIAELHLLTSKKVLYVANVDEDSLAGNEYSRVLQEYATTQDCESLVICSKLEEEISKLDEGDRNVFLNDMGMDQSGLDRIIKSSYNLLGYQVFFTAGEEEVRAWTISIGTLAPAAAGKIHGDFEKNFIRAEVVGFSDYISAGGELLAKQQGKWRLEGKLYEVAEGDVVHFRTGS